MITPPLSLEVKKIHFIDRKSVSFRKWNSQQWKKCSSHVEYVYIHWAARHPVRIVLLLMTMTKSVVYAIHVNCKEDMQYKLKIVIPVLKIFVNLTLEASYAPIVTTINVINEKNLPWCDWKTPEHDLCLSLRDWYCRGFKLFWEEELRLRFNCSENKGFWVKNKKEIINTTEGSMVSK